MTIEIICPTCFQPAKLRPRLAQQDYVLLTHKTRHGFKCASSGNAYSKKLVEKLFVQGGRK